MSAEHEGDVVEQVIEVEGRGFTELAFVERIDLGDRLGEEVIGGGGIFRWGQKLIFSPADLALNPLRGETHIIDAGQGQAGLDDLHPVALIVDGEVLIEADLGSVAA